MTELNSGHDLQFEKTPVTLSKTPPGPLRGLAGSFPPCRDVGSSERSIVDPGVSNRKTKLQENGLQFLEMNFLAGTLAGPVRVATRDPYLSRAKFRGEDAGASTDPVLGLKKIGSRRSVLASSPVR